MLSLGYFKRNCPAKVDRSDARGKSFDVLESGTAAVNAESATL